MPGSRPFDLFDPDRKGRIKLYVRRVFITDEAELLPRYLRFVRGLVDSADLPLNVSREMIQESPCSPRSRRASPAASSATWRSSPTATPRPTPRSGTFSAPCSRRASTRTSSGATRCSKLARFRSTTSAEARRSLEDYVAAMKPDQKAIYYIAGDDRAQLEASPQLEGFRARGIEVLLLTDPVDSFWVMRAPSFDGKPFKSVTQGAADLAADPAARRQGRGQARGRATPSPSFIAFVKLTLGDAVSDVRASERLTDSAVCLVAPEQRPRPPAGEAARTARAASCRRPSRSSRSTRATSSSPRSPKLGDDEQCLQGGRRASAVRRGARARRRAGRATPRRSPSGWPG